MPRPAGSVGDASARWIRWGCLGPLDHTFLHVRADLLSQKVLPNMQTRPYGEACKAGTHGASVSLESHGAWQGCLARRACLQPRGHGKTHPLPSHGHLNVVGGGQGRLPPDLHLRNGKEPLPLMSNGKQPLPPTRFPPGLARKQPLPLPLPLPLPGPYRYRNRYLPPDLHLAPGTHHPHAAPHHAHARAFAQNERPGGRSPSMRGGPGTR
jgi:hypothetical protein